MPRAPRRPATAAAGTVAPCQRHGRRCRAALIVARLAARATTRRTAAPGGSRRGCGARCRRRRATAAARALALLPRRGHRCQQPRSRRVPPPAQRAERGRLARNCATATSGKPARRPRRGRLLAASVPRVFRRSGATRRTSRLAADAARHRVCGPGGTRSLLVAPRLRATAAAGTALA
jgi:hypothetical protein